MPAIDFTKRELTMIYQFAKEHRDRERNAVAEYRRQPWLNAAQKGAIDDALREAESAESIMDKIHFAGAAPTTTPA